MEEDECPSEEMQALVDKIVEKYDQLQSGIGSGVDRAGSAAEDRLNDILELFLDLGRSGRKLTPEQEEHLRSKCTLPSNVRITFGKKRTGAGRKRATTDYFLSNEEEGERTRQHNRRRRPKKKAVQQSQQSEDDDMEQSDDDDDEDEDEKKGEDHDESMAQEDDDESMKSDDERSYQSDDETSANEAKDRPPTEDEEAAALAKTTASEARRKVEATMDSDDEGGPTPVRQLSAFVPREMRDRTSKLERVREVLMEFRDNLADMKHDTEYALVMVPSFMDQTEDSVNTCYLEENVHVDVGIKGIIQNCIDLHVVGMKAASLFLDSGDKQLTRVTFTSLAELATILEETTTAPTPEDVKMRNEIQLALDHAKKSQHFTLPNDTSTRSLAKQWLAMGESTRSQLFVLPHSAAGAHAFRLLTLTDLTTGKKPILSEEALAILKCDYKEELQDTSELLKRLKEAFDDENISYKDKTTLMLCFLRIKKLLQDLPDDKWATIDRSEREWIFRGNRRRNQYRPILQYKCSPKQCPHDFDHDRCVRLHP